MSNCCKCTKWFPHNWLCLKGLSIVFVVLFYLAVAFAIYQAIAIIAHPGLTGSMMWMALVGYVLTDLAAALGFLTVAKILTAIHKIKKAVAPCCCENKKTEETK
ncbi:MAG: hypothetical protein IKP96_06100 [Elusimicrobiaceae bacterium]|nr:hypothetical protein [Elusimicrobiaceae bacterium]